MNICQVREVEHEYWFHNVNIQEMCQSTKIDDLRDQTLSVLAFAYAKYSCNTNVKNGCVLL